VRDAIVDVLIDRHPHDVGVKVTRREGELEVVVLN
jgi:hypothetical protein